MCNYEKKLKNYLSDVLKFVESFNMAICEY